MLLVNAAASQSNWQIACFDFDDDVGILMGFFLSPASSGKDAESDFSGFESGY